MIKTLIKWVKYKINFLLIRKRKKKQNITEFIISHYENGEKQSISERRAVI